MPVADIEAFAKAVGTTPRSLFRLGYGFTRSRNGAAQMHAALCIPAVTGAFVVTKIAPPFAANVTLPVLAVTDVVAGELGCIDGRTSDTVIPRPAVKLTLSTASTVEEFSTTTFPDAFAVIDDDVSAVGESPA